MLSSDEHEKKFYNLGAGLRAQCKTMVTHYFHKFTFCSFGNLIVKYMFYENIKIHATAKNVFIPNLKIV